MMNQGKEKRPDDIQTVFEKMKDRLPLAQRVTLLQKTTALLIGVLVHNFSSDTPGIKTNIESELEDGLISILKNL